MAPGVVNDVITEQLYENKENSKPLIKSTSSTALDATGHEISYPWLLSSPYNNPTHLLDLRTLDTPYSLFAQALSAMEPVREDYATAAYELSFNWATILSSLRELCAAEKFEWQATVFYVVIFRSQLQPDIDRALLGLLDENSHEEASISGGLLKYWFGKPNEDRRNLATCLWRSKEDARKGGTGPWHFKARKAAAGFYEQIRFSSHRLEISDGAEGWSFQDWHD